MDFTSTVQYLFTWSTLKGQQSPQTQITVFKIIRTWKQ
jgi:hypothetical protein